MRLALGFLGFVLGAAVANGCGPRATPHFVFDGMPGLVVPTDDTHTDAAVCTAAANRCIMLGCGCGIQTPCKQTPEELWCIARAGSCADVEACQQ